MKLLYYSSTFFVDSDFPLIKELQKAGIDVYYIIELAPFSKRSTLIDIKEQIDKSAILKASEYKEFTLYGDYINLDKVFVVNRTESSVLSLNNIKLTFRLYSFIREINPDVIHIITPLDTLQTILYRFRRKMVLTMHDPFPHTGESNKRKTFFRNLALKMVPRIVLLNETQKEEFKAAYGIKEEQVFLNKIGRFDYLDIFSVKGRSVNKSSVLFFGRISPYKGVEYLCKAMMKVRQHIPDATLTIAGGGKMYFDITPYQQQPWVKVLNRYIGMEELAGLLQDCAVTVCPYTDATQSGVIMTSYSLCKPVIATNVGGLSEMVEDGKTGLLVPPKDVDALADAIISLLKDRKKLDEMAMSIMNDYFVGDKSWKVIADRYVALYNKIKLN